MVLIGINKCRSIFIPFKLRPPCTIFCHIINAHIVLSIMHFIWYRWQQFGGGAKRVFLLCKVILSPIMSRDKKRLGHIVTSFKVIFFNEINRCFCVRCCLLNNFIVFTVKTSPVPSGVYLFLSCSFINKKYSNIWSVPDTSNIATRIHKYFLYSCIVYQWKGFRIDDSQKSHS